jgi:hypothetical protein
VQAPVPFALRAGKTFRIGDPLDFDSVDNATLDRFDFVVASAAGYGSTPPPNFALARTTPSFRLWRRTGPIGSHGVLSTEGTRPSALLDCSTREGRDVKRIGGTATVTGEPRVFRGPAGGGVGAGVTTTLQLSLPAGRQAVSLQYRSPQTLRLSAPGYRASLPANLDGPGPYWPAGTIDVPRAGVVTFTLTTDKASPIFARSQFATVPSLAVTPAAAPRRVPAADACGRWVDWYGR